MIDRDLLISASRKKHMTFNDLAKALDIDRATFSRKLRTKGFTVDELTMIRDALQISRKEMFDIFFAD